MVPSSRGLIVWKMAETFEPILELSITAGA
jgi:hypothetical protein